MNEKEIIKRLKELETNAQRLLKYTAALREELSGGSDSSNLKPALSERQVDELLAKSRKRRGIVDND